MSTNLVKGGNVLFSKETSNNHIIVGLGWKTANHNCAFDVYAGVFLLTTTGKVRHNNDLIFYGNEKSIDGSIKHSRNCSIAHGDIASFNVNLAQIPRDIGKLVIVASIHDAQKRRQNFSMVGSAFIRVISPENQQEILRFNLNDYNGSETAMLFGEIYRYHTDWKFRAIGQGFAGGLPILAKNYGLTGFNPESLPLPPIHPQTDNPTMTTDIFNQLSHKATQIEQNWNTLYQNLVAAQPDNPHLDFEHFDQLNETFQAALKRLHDDLNAPTLILATTGTTSSGKSTIVNLLCGADLMPRMAQEMSAGVVYINHSPEGGRHLKVHQTNGALWECGEWLDVADTDIRDKLTAVMDSFNKSKGINQPETPRIELTYPLACFSNPELLGLASLPKKTQFKLMDLPGLRNSLDITNAEVIKNCRDALCLVAYNMEETDENRRRELVRQVLEQIKNMGGSPARMLFVLNRIDVFRKDRDWERYQAEYIEKTQAEIIDVLHKHLPEHRDILKNLTYSRLSSLPALHAQRIKTDKERVQAAIEIQKHFNSLISDEKSEDLALYLPARKWSEHQFNCAGEEVWKNSYGAEFFVSLDKHIQNHFPVLVIPTIVKNFEKEANHVIGEIMRTCYSELNGSQEKYEQACALLRKQDAELHQFLDQAKQVLLTPLVQFVEESKQKDLNLSLENFAEKLTKTSIFWGKITKDKLEPLGDWHRHLLENPVNILGDIRKSLDNGKCDFSNMQTDKLSEVARKKLAPACRDYIDAMKEKNKDKFETQLDQFLSEVGIVIHESLNNQIRQENARIHDTMDLIAESYLNYLRDGMDRLAPEWNLEIGHYMHREQQVSEIDLSQLLSRVNVQTEETYLGATLITGAAANAARMLFLGSNPWGWAITAGIMLAGALYDDEKKSLPNGQMIYDQGKKELNECLSSLSEQFYNMILRYVEDLTTTIEIELARVLKDFEKKLKNAHDGHQGKHANVLSVWEPLLEQTKDLKQLSAAVTEPRNYL